TRALYGTVLDGGGYACPGQVSGVHHRIELPRSPAAPCHWLFLLHLIPLIAPPNPGLHPLWTRWMSMPVLPVELHPLQLAPARPIPPARLQLAPAHLLPPLPLVAPFQMP